MLKTKSKHFISIYIFYLLSSVDEYVRFTFSYIKETLLHVHVDTRVGKQVYIYIYHTYFDRQYRSYFANSFDEKFRCKCCFPFSLRYM